MVSKLITKTMVNKIKTIMADLVTPNQCNFVPGRHSTDNIVICKEIIHSLKDKHGMKGTMIIKVDLAKAYERLKWGFIRKTLEDVGLPI